MASIQRIQADGVFTIPGIHAGVRVGELLFISGQAPVGPGGELVGTGDFRAQAVQVFENLGAVLAAGGSSFNRIVKLGVFLLDVSRDLSTYQSVRDEYISANHAPAGSVVQVAKLSHPSMWIEVEAVAVCRR